MAGGDYALIKSVEGFEDFAPFGRRQVADLGLAAGDTLFAITEGGETSFVIGTAWHGVDVGARVFFVYNNPDEDLRANVRRSREVIDDPRIEKVNLASGPMAITGSTRMQATSIELLAMMTVLEMVVRELLGADGRRDMGVGRPQDVPAEMREGLSAVHERLTSAEVLGPLGRLVETEERVYRQKARTSYFAHSLGVDVLTDTTERSPTFCTPSFRKWDDTEASESWAFLFTAEAQTEAAWPALLHRRPQTIEWTAEDLRQLLDEEAAARQAAVLREIGLRDLMRFRIGLDGLAYRPTRPGDAVTVVVSEPDLPLVALGRLARSPASSRSASAVGAQAVLIAVGREGALARVAASAARASATTVRRPSRRGDALPARPAYEDRREDAAQRAVHVHDGEAGAGARQPDDLGRAEQPQADRSLDALHPRHGQRVVRGGVPRAVRGDRVHRAAPHRGQDLPAPGWRGRDPPARRREPRGGGSAAAGRTVVTQGPTSSA